MTKIQELQRKLSKQLKEQDRLLQSIVKSKAIQTIWPDVFDNNPVKSYWTGRLMTNQKAHAMAAANRKNTATSFTVTNGLGESRKFEPHLVPEVLRHPNLIIPQPEG